MFGVTCSFPYAHTPCEVLSLRLRMQICKEWRPFAGCIYIGGANLVTYIRLLMDEASPVPCFDHARGAVDSRQRKCSLFSESPED